MIHRVFELEDTLVREVMAPRPDMFCLDVATETARLLPLLREHLHSRGPVFEDTIAQIVGVLYTKDLLPYLDGLPPTFDLREHLHPPYFVPGSKRADALLREFQAKNLHLAIVVAAHGGLQERGGVIYVWLIGVSLLVPGLFSAAEMWFIAANRVRLRHMAEGGNRTAIRYLDAFRSPERLLSTAMMGVTIAHITASSVATWALLPVAAGAAAILVTVAPTPISLLFRRALPKAR